MNSLIHQAQKLKEVKRLAQSGRMIDAIKLYREITNAGLKEAKDAVESLQRGDPFIRLDDVSTTATPQAEKMKEVVRLIKGGNKIEAIKLFREATGVGLKEAKDAVEAIERNRSATINTVTTSTPYTTAPATPQAAAMQEVIRLVQSGNKIEAIKKFRELYGVGLKEAKDVIDGMDKTGGYNSGTPLPSGFNSGTPSTPPMMETVSPLNGVVILFLLFVLLISGAAALVWFVSPELRELIINFLK
ncbi:MAG: ribosomal protein L7/L12 [Chloroflexi bacterium]|nr:ribosomal protein L7/L12 [Chloroflexota bacterium]